MGCWLWESRHSLCVLADLDLLLWRWYAVIWQIYNYPYLKSYNDNREITKQTRSLHFEALQVGIFAHKYDLDLVKVDESGLTYFSAISSDTHRPINLRTAFILDRLLSDRIVAHVVIRMTLAYFRANDRHFKEQF